MYWQTARRKISLAKTLVMGIINVTPDSFSDGGKFFSVDDALRQAEKLITEGADILDVGGESTRPNSARVSSDEESARVVPVIEAIAKRFGTPISIDTTKAEVAENAVAAGAEIVNDISGLRFDPRIGEVAAIYGAGLVLMHSRGSFETMHTLSPVDNILSDVALDFSRAVFAARSSGVADEQIVLDIGIGFSKTLEQNLELLAKLGKLVGEFPEFPILVGTSRKSFIAKILGESSPDERLAGSLASIVVAVWNGAKIIRVHDVRPTVGALTITQNIRSMTERKMKP
ncbi:MAG TPA: dihydropteroate synthase [Pyrinomonadaceae bacterium]|jgi:dihydropteroate synthase|nr:dihydropteroate synthase [Pyrinomonadaceae bacterium]